MEFQEQRPRTGRPGTARPETAQSRPFTAQSVTSPFFDSSAPTRPSPFSAPTVEAGSLSQVQHLSSPERRPATSMQSLQAPQVPLQQMLPPQRLFNRNEVTAPREVAPTRPSSAQIYQSYTTPSQPSQFLAPPELHRQPSDPVIERPSSTSNVANLESIRNAIQQDDAMMGASELPTQPPATNEHYSSATTDVINRALLSSDPATGLPQFVRPSTAASMALPDTLEHEIPPRRELPFQRSSSDKHSSRPGTSALSLPPLPKPRLGKEGSRSSSGSPEKIDTAARPSTASPLKRTLAATEIEEHARLKTAGRATIAGSLQAVSSSRRASPTGTATSARKPSRMDDLLNSRKPLSERSANTSNKIPRMNSLADAPHETVSPPVSPSKTTSTTSPVRQPAALRDPTINAYTACISSPSRNPDVGLEAYASQSRADREAALDEFMVANLENAAFTQLCEDVENCWRRIALGL